MQMNMDYNKLPEDNNDFSPLPTGVYEMVVNGAKEHATPNGAESFQIDFIVRNDLDGVPALKNTNAKYHNRHVFMDNWKRRATNQYSQEAILQIMAAAGFPDKKSFDFPNESIDFLFHKPMKVYVKKTTNEYNGEKREINQIAPWGLNPTDYPSIQHEFKNKGNNDNQNNGFGNGSSNPTNNDPFANSGNQVDISDDDLPF